MQLDEVSISPPNVDMRLTLLVYTENKFLERLASHECIPYQELTGC